MPNPKPINSQYPAPPTKLCHKAKMDKKAARNLYRLFCPLTRPAHISPKKKVKWRLVKKWFNRYEKATWIDRFFTVTSLDGTTTKMRVIDIRLKKAGGHKRDYDFTAVPMI